ncbi:uncharacterized protein DS421_8g233630 [Arachis hypogaea]|nr:uncharacterized protein DS421_8g233630 [Arachis hypogaea]
MILSRGGHLKASRNGLIFGRLLRFFSSFFLRCADRFFWVVLTGFFPVFLCCADRVFLGCADRFFSSFFCLC